MLPTTTRVPAVADALYTRLTERLADVLVIDGPLVNQSVEGDVLAIGVSTDGGVAVDVDIARQDGLGAVRYAETFEINCVISTVSGDTDMAPRRNRCKAILDDVDAELKESAGLGGVADLVGIGPTMQWGQAQTKDGAVCEISFSIVGRALL